MVTRSTSFGPTAIGTADTETTIGSAYSFPGSGVIKKLRVVFDQATADIGMQGILYLYFKKLAGPFEFVVGAISGKLTAGEVSVPATEIDVDIPYVVGEQVTVKMKTTEVTADATVSICMVE